MTAKCHSVAGLAGNFLRNGVTAHRGNSAVFPQNTMVAVESALGLGADWIELDVQKTADEELVVIHDKRTGNVADIDLEISKCDYEQLMLVDVAYRHRKKNNLSLEECPKARIPLLSEVLDVILLQRRSRLSIQPKDWCVEDACDLVRRRGAIEWVGFNDTSFEKMKCVKKLCESIPVFWDRYPFSFIGKDLDAAKEYGFECVVIHYLGVTRSRISRIHRSGLEVGAWTVNGHRQLRRLIAMGVDRIYTDDPGLLLGLRASRPTEAEIDRGR